jgi:hypothetical protein
MVTSMILLQGVTLPANQSAAQDLLAAIDNIFMHPNVGPFIGKQLIQHLVTSNRVRRMLQRVAQAFADNGSGVRGDMKAVIKAILLDDEAAARIRRRIQARTSPASGAVCHESVARIQSPFGRRPQYRDGYLNPPEREYGPGLFRPPSVFSYFSPSTGVPGSSLRPRVRILNTSTSGRRANFVNTMVFSRVASQRIHPYGTYEDLGHSTPSQAIHENWAILNPIMMRGRNDKGNVLLPLSSRLKLLPQASNTGGFRQPCT